MHKIGSYIFTWKTSFSHEKTKCWINFYGIHFRIYFMLSLSDILYEVRPSVCLFVFEQLCSCCSNDIPKSPCDSLIGALFGWNQNLFGVSLTKHSYVGISPWVYIYSGQPTNSLPLSPLPSKTCQKSVLFLLTFSRP